MSERFIKFIPSEEAFWLLHNKPNAFRLLTHIANNARWQNGHPDGLTIGQCHLQHWMNYDLTEQEYRTAKQILVKRKHIEILETNRTRKKSTTGSTTASTLVKLCSSMVYDINIYEGNDRINDRSTTDQRLINDKLEGRRRKKKEEEEEEQPQTPSFSKSKIQFRQHVHLAQTEFDSLLSKHGQEFLDRMLNALDSYKGSTGKQYKSDFHTMKEGGWVIERVRKDLLTPHINGSSEATGNEILGKKLEQKYFNYTRGWRCSIYRDQKKDQRGLLFECENSYVTPHFIAFTNGAFKDEVLSLLKTKNMGEI